MAKFMYLKMYCIGNVFKMAKSLILNMLELSEAVTNLMQGIDS